MILMLRKRRNFENDSDKNGVPCFKLMAYEGDIRHLEKGAPVGLALLRYVTVEVVGWTVLDTFFSGTISSNLMAFIPVEKINKV